MRTKLPIW